MEWPFSHKFLVLKRVFFKKRVFFLLPPPMKLNEFIYPALTLGVNFKLNTYSIIN